MQVQPYLFFEGRTEEALDYYQRTLGARVVGELMRFKDNPEPAQNPPGAGNKVMHVTFQIGDATLMASDGMCSGTAGFQGFSLSLGVKSDSEAERLFAALSDGGTVQMPLDKTFWTSRFGMVMDRFGVSWMVNVVA